MALYAYSPVMAGWMDGYLATHTERLSARCVIRVKYANERGNAVLSVPRRKGGPYFVMPYGHMYVYIDTPIVSTHSITAHSGIQL